MAHTAASNVACHCVAGRRAFRAMTSFYDHALAPFGVTLPQFSLLRNIARLGELSINDLASHVGLDRTTIGRNLRPLERAGFVTLVVGSEDLRQRKAILTAKGLRVLEECVPAWEAAQHEVERRIPARDLTTLHTLLSRVEAAFS